MKRTIKAFMLTLILGLILCGSSGLAKADDEEVRDQWDWTLDNGVLTITGTGIVDTIHEENLPDKGLWDDDQVTYVKVSIGITGIGQSTFFGCSNMTNCSLPPTLEIVEARAFMNCTSLLDIYLWDNVTTVMDQAFANCTSMTYVYLGDKLTSKLSAKFISPFQGCTSLTKFSVGANSSALLDDDFLCGSQINTPDHLEWIFYRGTKEQLFADLANVHNGAILFADEISCQSGGVVDKDTEPVFSNDYYTIYGSKKVECKGKELNINGGSTSGGTFYNFWPYVEEIDMDYTVTAWADNQMGNLSSLKKIVYGGTEEEWNAIDKGTGNDLPAGCEVTFHVHTAGGQVVHDPTCLEEGYTCKTCSTCGREYGDPYDIVQAAGHTLVVEEKDATCSSKGYIKKECSVEGCYYSEIEWFPIDPDNHYITTETIKADCMHAGEVNTYCVYCRKQFTHKQISEKLDHQYLWSGNYTDGSQRFVCLMCGKSKNQLEAPTMSCPTSVSVGWFSYTEPNMEVYYSTDAGKTWTLWGRTGSSGKLTMKYTAGKTYYFRCRRLMKYKDNGTTVKEYSSYSAKIYVQIPKTLPDVTGVTNVNGGQLIQWNKVSTISSAKKIYYFLWENGSTGDGTYNNWDYLKTNYLTLQCNNVNGRKYTYKAGCMYTDSKGTYHYIYTGKAISYYYLSRPALSYYKSTAAGNIKLNWKRNTKASGYVVKVVYGSSSKPYWITSNKTLTKTITGLKKGKTYKCYVRSYKTVSGIKYYSAWSAYKNVTVKK